MVGLGASKSGQKRMMDIDDGFAPRIQEDRRKHLHIAGHYNEIDVMGLQEGELLCLGFRL